MNVDDDGGKTDGYTREMLWVQYPSDLSEVILTASMHKHIPLNAIPLSSPATCTAVNLESYQHSENSHLPFTKYFQNRDTERFIIFVTCRCSRFNGAATSVCSYKLAFLIAKQFHPISAQGTVSLMANIQSFQRKIKKKRISESGVMACSTRSWDCMVRLDIRFSHAVTQEKVQPYYFWKLSGNARKRRRHTTQ